jgi:hypothetical protein
MEKMKKITFEVPESTFLLDMVYYWRESNGNSVKAMGYFEGDYIADGAVVRAHSNKHIQTFEKEEQTDVAQPEEKPAEESGTVPCNGGR